MHLTSSKYLIIRHLIFWFILFHFHCFIHDIYGNHYSELIYATLKTLNFAILYYCISFYIFEYYYKRKWIYLGLLIIISISMFYGINYFNHVQLRSEFFNLTQYETNPIKVIKESSIFYLIISIASISTSVTRNSIEKLKRTNQEIITLNEYKLSFYKEQFNSHLSLNFFSHCYNVISENSKIAAKNMESFTNILQYSLVNENKMAVPILNEINYIKDFIKINKCISSNIFVDFYVEGNVKEKSITPMILCLFVENAFKHGITSDKHNPVKIALSITDEFISFKISNKIKYNSIHSTPGFGLKTLKELLVFNYNKGFELDVNCDETNYNLSLKISLK